MLDGSNDADLRKDVPFGGFVDIASHFGGEIPPKPKFLGREYSRRFQAKRAKYWKFHVIETNASISTKFCATIETKKNSSWVVPIGAQQIQDGGRPPFKKPLNRYISATVWPILMKFGMMTHIAPYSGSTVKISENSRWRQTPFWKSQKSRYLRNGLTDLYEIWYADAKWVS